MATVEAQADGRVFVFVYSRTANGFWTLDGLPNVLPTLDDAAALGEAARAALDTSTDGVLPARDVRADPPDREFLAWFGGSAAKYARGVRSVQLRAEYDDRLTEVIVTPQANEGKGSFTGIREHRATERPQDAAEFGAILQRAVARATR